MLGPILAIFLSHVFGAALGTRVPLVVLTRRERWAVLTRPHEVSPAASPCAGEDGNIELYHRGVRELEPRAHLMESEI